MELIEISLIEGLSQLKGYVSCTSYIFHDAEKWAIPCPGLPLPLTRISSSEARVKQRATFGKIFMLMREKCLESAPNWPKSQESLSLEVPWKTGQGFSCIMDFPKQSWNLVTPFGSCGQLQDGSREFWVEITCTISFDTNGIQWLGTAGCFGRHYSSLVTLACGFPLYIKTTLPIQ